LLACKILRDALTEDVVDGVLDLPAFRRDADLDEVPRDRLAHHDESVALPQEVLAEGLVHEPLLMRDRVVDDPEPADSLAAQLPMDGPIGRSEEGHPVHVGDGIRLPRRDLLRRAHPAPGADRVDPALRRDGMRRGALLELGLPGKQKVRVLAGERHGQDFVAPIEEAAVHRLGEVRDPAPVGVHGAHEGNASGLWIGHRESSGSAQNLPQIAGSGDGAR